ncbi:MAG: acyltransferase [Solirubrobacterales bacterium]|nr:acyltransferase [Solirubrobacterales bacterium]
MKPAQVPDVAAPPPGNPHFPMFEGLRAIAALSILFSHVFLMAGYNHLGLLGNWTSLLVMGVPLFFVISGFLLYRPFVAADMSGRSPAPLPTFMRRRLLRIVPAYWVALTLMSLFPYNALMFEHWERYYLFLQIYYPPEQAGLPQAWSICVEMVFYISLPFYAWFMRRVQVSFGATRRVQSEIVLLGGLSVVSAFFYYQWAKPFGATPFNSGLPRFMFWFALGMGVALISSWVTHQRRSPIRLTTFIARRPGAFWASALGVFILAGLFVTVDQHGMIFERRSQMIYWALSGVTVFLLILPAAFSEPGRSVPSRVLMNRVLVWLGVISYGMYLWQFRPLEWAAERGVWLDHTVNENVFLYLAVGVGFTIPMAALSYYIVEKPFLKLKFSRRRSG